MSFIAAVAFAGSSLFFQSCNQSDADRAEDRMEDAKENVQDKADDMEAWMEFRRESKEEIADNRAKIAELREKQAESGKTMDKVYQARINELEEQNNKRDQEIDDYKPKNAEWQEFKMKFRAEMDKIGDDIRSLDKDNKK